VPTLTGWQRLALQSWFALIAVSVLTTYQHHVLDVPAGAVLGALVLLFTARDRTHRWRLTASSHRQ
jgi:membrane-associated phospholipid phosphatase